MVSFTLYIIGGLLLALAAADAFLTILAMRGGGPVTNWWMRAVWRLALWVHRRRRGGGHNLLSLTGPLMTVAAIVFWYLLLFAGWSCIYLAHEASVIVARTEAPATLVERVSFVGATIMAVGYGDLVPSHFPWTILANASAFMTTFLITTSLSYLMPIISAAVERRQLALNIFSIGKTPQEIVRASWTSGNAEMLNPYWMNLFNDINNHSQKHLVYPVLHYFHSKKIERSSSRALLNLSDALFLIRQAKDHPEKPPEGFFSLARTSIRNYAELQHIKVAQTAGEQLALAGQLSRRSLIELGIEPVDEATFDAAMREYLPMRKQLVELCVEDGWMLSADEERAPSDDR
jgi:hypothetical protein